MDIAVLLLRLVLGVLMFAHATQKLLGWFDGPGLAKQSGGFERLGLTPGRPMVLLAGLSELAGAMLLALGLLTPLGVLMGVGTMAVAALSLFIKSGAFWNLAGGGEYPAVLAAMALVLGFSGAGAYSVDAVLADASDSLSFLATPPAWLGVLVIVVTAAATVPFVVVMRRNKAAAAA